MIPTLTTFSPFRVRSLRRSASDARRFPERLPIGWSKSPIDPMDVMRMFLSLRLRPGLSLRAYHYFDGGNGNGFVCAMPADAAFPEPDDCPRDSGGFLSPPVPPGALGDFMKAIEGERSPWSYLSASILARELREFGALWHGCDWSTHKIIGANPIAPGDPEAINPDAEGWSWLEPVPEDWRLTVTLGDAATGTFMTRTELGSERIVRHVDTFKPGRYTFRSKTTVLAERPGGFVF